MKKELKPQAGELIVRGFKIEQKKPWHWRITKPDSEIIVDVYPTAKKMWVVGSLSSTAIYSNLRDAVFIKFGISKNQCI